MNLPGFGTEAHFGYAGQQPAEPLDPLALVAQLGSEVASTLSSALDRVATLAATGRIDRAGLRSLREELARAHRVGIMGQQMVRLGHGGVQLAAEPLDLAALLDEALRLRRPEIEARAIEVRRVFTPADLVSDATLVFSLLETLLDWTFEHAVSRIDLLLDVHGSPAAVRLTGSFVHGQPLAPEPGAAPPAAEVGAVNSMAWCLLQQTASVLRLRLQRRNRAGRTDFLLEFPEAAPARERRLGQTGTVREPGLANQAWHPQPLAGRHVVVVAARREVRNLVRETLQSMGLMMDFAASIEQARALFADALPHAVVCEATLGGERFERLRGEILALMPNLAFIQIAAEGKAFEVLNVGTRQVVSVGNEAIAESLPAALFFEFSRQG